MEAVASRSISSERVEQRAQRLFEQQLLSGYKHTDRLIAGLMLCQWLAGVVIALIVSPRAWAGRFSDIHIHVWIALFVGALITLWPVFLAVARPGSAVTRHTIAIGQTLYSALLIHLTGGRIETHFHIFGSLAFLSFYRDWRVLVTASLVVAVDHCVRGFYFPQSVYGVASIEPWRWVEHSWWVVFEDLFLIHMCRRNVQELYAISYRQAEVEVTNENIEAKVLQRTSELSAAKQRLGMEYAVAKSLTEPGSWKESVRRSLELIARYLQTDQSEQILSCCWLPDPKQDRWYCLETSQLPYILEPVQERQLDAMSSLCRSKVFQQAVHDCMPVCFDDLQDDEVLAALLSERGLRTGLIFPLLAGGEVVGVFQFFSASNLNLGDDSGNSFMTMGAQIGQFIVNRRIEAERSRLANVVQFSCDAIITTSATGTIMSWNRGAERLFGYVGDEVLQYSISDLFPADAGSDVMAWLTAADWGERVEEREITSKRKNGSLFETSVSASALFDDCAQFLGCSVTIRDITERKEAERRVSEFYSIVSHELRTPLTSIRGALGLIEGNVVEMNSNEGIELITVARGSTDRLIRLINDILDLKKIESGKMELHKGEIEVECFVSATVQVLAGLADAAAVELVHESGANCSIYADYDKATQVLTNLVSNAIKFSPEKSRVVVAVRPGRQSIRFEVTDNGPGIAESDIQKLFGKFQQIDSSDTRHKGGTGLGLAISKAIVEQHGGAIGVESRLGEGSTFWFDLPAYRSVASVVSANADAGGSARSLLLVEDDIELASVLSTYLSKDGYSVSQAASLLAARTTIRDALFDLIILDVVLPDGNGLDLIKDLRSDPDTLEVPIIVISGEHHPSGLVGGATVVDWLSKPLDLRDLGAAIKRALAVPGPCKVLVVDDDRDSRRVVVAQLKSMGLTCIEAKDGLEAIQLARAESPDLIILDVMMDRVDGFEVVQMLRHEVTGLTPLIIYTGKDLSLVERNSLTLGVTRHLIKSVSGSPDLAAAVRELLNHVLPLQAPESCTEEDEQSKVSEGRSVI